MDGRSALERLVEGNARYASGGPEGPNRSMDRRRSVVVGQDPFAAVLTCSDSRVVPELIFDTGIGDIFVVRTAGNVADEVAVGSIEYAVGHLGVRLVLVLGHTSCSAVGAILNGLDPEGCLGSIARAIRPSVDAGRGSSDEYLEATLENVRRTVGRLSRTGPTLAPAVEGGDLLVIGAMYDLADGRVETL